MKTDDNMRMRDWEWDYYFHQAQLGLVLDCHPNQGRRVWRLQSSWVKLEQDTLTSRLDGFGADSFLFFESEDMLLTQGSDQKRLAKPEIDKEILR